MNKIFLIVIITVYAFLGAYTTLTVYECLSVTLFTFAILSFINNIGKRLAILDIMILITILSCLILPIAGYHHFNATNRTAKIWFMYMKVPTDDYYSFMLPATVSMIIGLKLPIFFRNETYPDHIQYLTNAKMYLSDKKYTGLVLVIIGLLSSILGSYVPAVIGQIFFLLRYLLFVGAFYCLYSNLPNKKLIIVLIFCILIARSISGGMFGEMVYMSGLTFILVMLGNKMHFTNKLTFFSLGVFLVLVLQAAKPAFRKQTWFGKNQNSKISIFADVFQEKFTNPSSIFSNDKALFLLYSRFNEGLLISNVLKSVPSRFPYAEGETIAVSLAATLVPRFLWSDKPEAGGAYNFKRFLGIKLKGWSANISPFGEAWGNFGKTGGIVFMFFFGLLFNFLFQWLLKIATLNYSVILWFPYLFFYSVNIENDVMSMLNSFTKAAILMYFLYKIFPLVLRVKL